MSSSSLALRSLFLSWPPPSSWPESYGNQIKLWIDGNHTKDGNQIKLSFVNVENHVVCASSSLYRSNWHTRLCSWSIASHTCSFILRKATLWGLSASAAWQSAFNLWYSRMLSVFLHWPLVCSFPTRSFEYKENIDIVFICLDQLWALNCESSLPDFTIHQCYFVLNDADCSHLGCGGWVQISNSKFGFVNAVTFFSLSLSLN